MTSAAEHRRPVPSDGDAILNALPNPVLLVAPDGRIVDANMAAESFFEISTQFLQRQSLKELVPFGSPLLALIDQVRTSGSPVNEYKVDLGTPRIGGDRQVDLHVAPLTERPGHIVVMLQERTIADKMDRQLTHRSAARSVIALAAMLAHEIKNPLSGIRGAAQLLEQQASSEDRMLTRLICDEADRIVTLVDRMEVFGDDRPVARGPVNIHSVLDHVKRLAQSGFARNIRFVEDYDPSLPPVLANQDQLIQVFLNLVKNAAEAVADLGSDAEIQLTTAFLARNRGYRCRSSSASRTTVRACRKTCFPTCSILSSPQSRPAADWDSRWWQRSSVITAASSNASPSRGKPPSACCCRCTTPPNISTRTIARTFRVRPRVPHRTHDKEQQCPQVAYLSPTTTPPSAQFSTRLFRVPDTRYG
jgi:two-component system, NtrC family, nitrogen regulation sensor histidine kinase GlnL